jgi:hypothetical protein
VCTGLRLVPLLDGGLLELQGPGAAQSAFVGDALDRELLAALPGLLVDTAMLGREVSDR